MKIFKNIFKADKSKQTDELETKEEKEEREFTELLNKRKQINVETTRITPIYSENPINHDSQVYNSEDTSKKEDTTQKNEVLDKLYLRRKQIAEFKIVNFIRQQNQDSRNMKYQNNYYNEISDEVINKFAIEYLEKYKDNDLKSQTDFLDKICKNNEDTFQADYVFVSINIIEEYIDKINSESIEDLTIVKELDKSILTEEEKDIKIVQKSSWSNYKVLPSEK